MSAAIPPLCRVVCEAAVSRVIGRDLTDNPFDNLNAPEQHDVWKFGWRYTDALLEHIVDHELACWLEDEAA